MWNQTFWFSFSGSCQNKRLVLDNSHQHKKKRCAMVSGNHDVSSRSSKSSKLRSDLSVQHTQRCSLGLRPGEFGGRVNSRLIVVLLKPLKNFRFVAGHTYNYILPFRDFKSIILSFGINGIPSILLLYYPADRTGHRGTSFQWKGEHNATMPK